MADCTLFVRYKESKGELDMKKRLELAGGGAVFTEVVSWHKQRTAAIRRKFSSEQLKQAQERLCIDCRYKYGCQELPLQLDGSDCQYKPTPKIEVIRRTNEVS